MSIFVRNLPPWPTRIVEGLFAIALCIDIVLCTLWLTPLYIFGLSDRPTGRQLISSYVGQAAINGHRWSIIPERIINTLFFWEPNHCRSCARRYKD